LRRAGGPRECAAEPCPGALHHRRLRDPGPPGRRRGRLPLRADVPARPGRPGPGQPDPGSQPPHPPPEAPRRPPAGARAPPPPPGAARGAPPPTPPGRPAPPAPAGHPQRVLPRALPGPTDARPAENPLLQSKYSLRLAQLQPVPDPTVHLLLQKDRTGPPFEI